MTNPLVQTLFSDTSLAVVGTAAKALLPDDFDWIADTAVTVLGTVDDVDALAVSGPEKADAIFKIVREKLDAVDDVPGWRDLEESLRDMLIGGFIDIAYVILRWTQNGKLDEAQTQTLARAVGDLIVAGAKLFAVARKPKTPVVERTDTSDAVLAALQ